MKWYLRVTSFALFAACVMSFAPSFADAALSLNALHQQRFNNDSTAAQTTSSFTPSNQVLLVAAVTFYESGYYDGSGAPTITITDSAGLTWTSRLAAEYDSVLSFPSGTRIFTAPVTTGTSMTVTVDVSQSTYIADTWDVQIFELSGYNTSSPVGLTAASGMDMTGTNLSLGGTTDTTSIVLALGLTDNTTSLTITPGTGWTEHYDTFTYPTQAQSQSYAGATSSVTWSAYASGAYSKWAVAIEFKAEAEVTAPTALTKPPNNLGLVGYWSFNDGVGTVATDHSGQGNHGQISGSTWTNGKRAKALSFDGTNDYVSMSGASLAAATDWTVALWVKRTGDGDTAEDFNSILTRGVASGYPRNYQIAVKPSDDLPRLRTSADAYTSIAGTTQLQLNTWYHIMGTYDDSDGSLKLYVNGVLENSTTLSTTPPSSASHVLELGRAPQEALNYFMGELDDIRVYTRVLQPAEAVALARAGAARLGASSVDLQTGSTLTSGLVGHWTFDGADFTDKVYDRSGQGKHGYVTNRATTTMKTAGKLGQAVSFDGYTGDYSYIEVASAPNLTGEHSMAFWIKPNAMANYNTVIDSQNSPGTQNDQYNAYLTTANTVATYMGSVCESTSQLAEGEWTHVAITWSSPTAMIYINGVLDETCGSLSKAAVTTSNLHLGARGVATYPLDATLDDVRLYDRSLTAAEVKQLSNLGQVSIVQ